MSIHTKMSVVMHNSALHETIRKWDSFLHSLRDWDVLIKDVQSKQTGCGLVYDIPTPIPAKHESFAIADMRTLAFSEPHYHPEYEQLKFLHPL